MEIRRKSQIELYRFCTHSRRRAEGHTGREVLARAEAVRGCFNTMKNPSTLAVALLAVAAASSLSGAVRFYAEPSVSLLSQDGLDNATGPVLAAGVTFADKHSVDLEAGLFETEFGSFSDMKVEIIPVTLNYRYGFPITEKLSGSMGISLGAMRQELNVPAIYYPYGVVYPYNASDTSFTGGFHAGISYRLNDHFSATLKAKALLTDEVVFRTDQTNTLLVQVGLNCRF